MVSPAFGEAGITKKLHTCIWNVNLSKYFPKQGKKSALEFFSLFVFARKVRSEKG